jgi:hypothetical protein
MKKADMNEMVRNKNEHEQFGTEKVERFCTRYEVQVLGFGFGFVFGFGTKLYSRFKPPHPIRKCASRVDLGILEELQTISIT